MNLSQSIKNGQQLRASAGAGAISANDCLLIGGPGNEAWTVGTSDYSTVANAGTLLGQTSVVASALPGATRQPMARDRLGNIYVAGTNGSGRLVIYKYGALGNAITSAVLDATATSVNNAHLFQLQSGGFCCVYARAAGALFFVIFDAVLNLVSGPISVATETAATNVVYHTACSLSGGGFAVGWQSAAGTQLMFATYSNVGANVQAAINVQTLAGSPSQMYLIMRQLSSGNLTIAWRGAMTAAAVSGTSFKIISTAGVQVAAAFNLDNVGTLGLLELRVLGAFFALAVGNGTNLVAGVFSNAGAQQGSSYSVGNTLNTVSYPQVKLASDGVQFWLVWFSSVSNGVYVISLGTNGATGSAASALGSATLSASTYALDAEVVNNLLVVLAASSLAAGQFLMTVGLPDSSLGILAPYVRSAANAFGTAAATTGSNGPRILSGGGGLYQGSNPPNGQPTLPSQNSDFTVVLAYDHQNVGGTFLGIQKVETSAILGLANTAVAINSPGTSVTVNPGQGEYPANTIAGTPGLSFNHLGGNPSGVSGVLYSAGAALSGLASSISSSAAGGVPPGSVFAYGGTSAPLGYLLGDGSAVSRITFAALFSVYGTNFGAGDGSTTFNLPDLTGRVIAFVDGSGVRLGGGRSGGITGPATLGAVGGEQSHAQIELELFPHIHPGVAAPSGINGMSTGGPVQGVNGGQNTGSTGGGLAMNVTQPTIVMNGIIKT